jgi:hypothetical protein
MAKDNIELVKQIVVQLSAANVPDGVGFLGDQLYRLLTPEEIIERAVAIADLLGEDK